MGFLKKSSWNQNHSIPHWRKPYEYQTCFQMFREHPLANFHLPFLQVFFRSVRIKTSYYSKTICLLRFYQENVLRLQRLIKSMPNLQSTLAYKDLSHMSLFETGTNSWFTTHWDKCNKSWVSWDSLKKKVCVMYQSLIQTCSNCWLHTVNINLLKLPKPAFVTKSTSLWFLFCFCSKTIMESQFRQEHTGT